MSKRPNSHTAPAKKIKAYELYMTTSKGMKEIAAEAGIPKNTLMTWVRLEKWSDKRIAMVTKGMSRIDQKMSANQEVSVDNHRRELDTLAEAVSKIRKKIGETDDVKTLVALVNSIKSSHSVSKTLITGRRQDPNRSQHHDDIPKNPVFFQMNIDVVPDRDTNDGRGGGRPLKQLNDIPVPVDPAPDAF